MSPTNMKKIAILGCLVVFLPLLSWSKIIWKKTEKYSMSVEKVNIEADMVCSYDYYQGMFPSSGKLELMYGRNDKPLEWSFLDLTSKAPTYLSGGDRGRILLLPHTHDDGVSFMVPQGMGVHIFTVWPNGTSLWSKHSNMLGAGSQQLVGTCGNIRSTK